MNQVKQIVSNSLFLRHKQGVMRKAIDKANCTEIGYVKKTHGVKGEVQIVFQEGLDELIEGLDYLFFDVEGLLVPFFIDSIFSIGPNSAILQFETLRSKEKAAAFAGCKLFIETEAFDDSDVEFSPQLLKGFVLIDQHRKERGTITAVDDYGGNMVFTVGKGRNELLVPFHDDLLLEFDPRKKKIVMQCPEGL